MKLIIKKTVTFIIALFFVLSLCLSLPCHPYVHAGDPIRIAGANGKEVVFPSYVIHMSPVIQMMVTGEFKEGCSKKYTLKDIDHQVLMQLSVFTEKIAGAARDADGKFVAVKNIDDQTIFVHALVKFEIRKGVATLGNTDLVNLYKASHFLGIQPLSNAFSFFIAERIWQLHKSGIETDEAKLRLEKLTNVEEGQSTYIEKHLHLLEKELNDFSIRDYIGLYGQPNVNSGTLDLTRHVDFSTRPLKPSLKDSQKLTSLYGIDQIKHPERIETLRLSGNHLLNGQLDPDFPISPFHLFTRLEELSVANNAFSTLPSSFLRGLSRLQKVDLSINALERVEEDLFVGLTQLGQVNLSCNQLKAVPEKLFRDTAGVEEVDVAANKLCAIPEKWFGNLGFLRDVKLSSNLIVELPENLFSGAPCLKMIDISRNPITQGDKRGFVKKHSLGENVRVKW